MQNSFLIGFHRDFLASGKNASISSGVRYSFQSTTPPPASANLRSFRFRLERVFRENANIYRSKPPDRSTVNLLY